MLLRALRLRHFRNISAATITPHHRFNIFAGPNGQGKTNLLEAIYLLSAVKSFRSGVQNAALVEFGEEEAMLEARVERGGLDRIVRVDIGGRGKKVFVNENPVRHLADFFGTLNVVTFGPEDISLLKGSPSERRRFIDRAIFNARPAFAAESSAYEDILKHRNALLKAPRLDRALLGVYDDQLVQYGADILLRRMEFLAEFVPVLRRVFGQIFSPDLQADLTYAPGWMAQPTQYAAEQVLDRGEVEGLLADALARTADEERDRGHTLVGPHRDDLVTTLNGMDVKTFASQGQHRAFVLAMKIAEITHLEERYHFAPILLLDDVSSELDRERNRFLFDFLRHRQEGQVFITTTHRDYILLDEDVEVFDVRSGQVAHREAPGAPLADQEEE